MRIGIYTQPLVTNFGGILQAYALQTVLKRMGHEVVTFDLPRYEKIKLIQILKKICYKYILKKKGYNFNEFRFNRAAYYTRKYTQPFINKNISRLIVRDFYKLSQNKFDAIVVGSDQTWRPMYNACIENSYLDFAENWNIRRIAYAVSFGTDDWEYTEEQTKVCSRLIKRFNAVSVRECSGINLCRQYLGYKDAVHVLDPTLLLDADDYLKFTSCNTSKEILFCYILDKSEIKNRIIDSVLSDLNIGKREINADVSNWNAKINDRIQYPVEEWLQGFVDSKYVITDSFHGCVFSIIFNKPFWVIGNEDRGMARFLSLLKIFNLEDRLLPESLDFSNFDISKPINWNAVNAIKKQWQKKSIEFIANNLPLSK